MMTLKTCNKCGEEKPFSAFRKDRSKADGHHGTCKRCEKEYKALPAAKETNKKYLQSPMGRKNKARKAQRYNRKYPERVVAVNALNRAVKSGSLTRQPCEVCGTEVNVQGHHPDYSKPLDVIWLCRTHHINLHADLQKQELHFAE